MRASEFYEGGKRRKSDLVAPPPSPQEPTQSLGPVAPGPCH